MNELSFIFHISIAAMVCQAFSICVFKKMDNDNILLNCGIKWFKKGHIPHG